MASTRELCASNHKKFRRVRQPLRMRDERRSNRPSSLGRREHGTHSARPMERRTKSRRAAHALHRNGTVRALRPECMGTVDEGWRSIPERYPPYQTRHTGWHHLGNCQLELFCVDHHRRYWLAICPNCHPMDRRARQCHEQLSPTLLHWAGASSRRPSSVPARQRMQWHHTTRCRRLDCQTAKAALARRRYETA